MSRVNLTHSLLSRGQVESSEEIKVRPIYIAAKRAFDVGVTLAAAPFALALVGTLALFVRMDGASAFYSQPRVGRGGKIFKLWKLRTMVPNADQKLQEYLSSDAVARNEWETMQKLKDDPRITRIGKYLRKYSLDEVPQLLNVFLGDMSLVGPRPMLPEQRQRYSGTAYYHLRPGLTGLWQIGERNASTFAERALIDARYSSTMSFGTDLWILSRTPAVVMRGRGL